MTKLKLIEQFAEFDGFESRAEAGRAFDHLITVITEAVTAGNGVALGQNFGSFKVVTQAARSGSVNGVAYNTAAKNVIKFRPSASLKATVAGK